VKRADREWTSPAVLACSAATAGLDDEVGPWLARAIEVRDPFVIIAIGTNPGTQWLRRVLQVAGALDEVREPIARRASDPG
jgi:hypothetical protein